MTSETPNPPALNTLQIEIDGDVMGRDCLVRYKSGGRTLAIASIYRDRQCLEEALAMEREAGGGAS